MLGPISFHFCCSEHIHTVPSHSANSRPMKRICRSLFEQPFFSTSAKQGSAVMHFELLKNGYVENADLKPITDRLMMYRPNGVFTRPSKRPANFQQMYLKYTC